VQIQDLKILFQLWIIAAAFSLDLLDDQLGITPGRGGLVDPSPLAWEPRALGPQNLKTRPGTGSRWYVGFQGLRWPSGAGTRWHVESQDPKWPPGVVDSFIGKVYQRRKPNRERVPT
jgi:hypothetical protein